MNSNIRDPSGFSPVPRLWREMDFLAGFLVSEYPGFHDNCFPVLGMAVGIPNFD
jgi:hypothetical protein